jgi:hypothetical protein
VIFKLDWISLSLILPTIFETCILQLGIVLLCNEPLLSDSQERHDHLTGNQENSGRDIHSVQMVIMEPASRRYLRLSQMAKYEAME